MAVAKSGWVSSGGIQKQQFGVLRHCAPGLNPNTFGMQPISHSSVFFLPTFSNVHPHTQGVGKSCLVLRYVRNTFDANSKITVCMGVCMGVWLLCCCCELVAAADGSRQPSCPPLQCKCTTPVCAFSNMCSVVLCHVVLCVMLSACFLLSTFNRWVLPSCPTMWRCRTDSH